MKGKRRSRGNIKKINNDVAGIDLGFIEHYVCIPQDREEENVRKFGCTTPELIKIREWLKGAGIRTVVMEATGVYWIAVYEILEASGFEVLLVNSYHVKNVPGRKTDILDCQWLQELGSYGLLRGAFIPKQEILIYRTYCRQREELTQSCSQQILRMQKSLDLMSLHLHKVLSDITGVSGMRIIRAIVAGERDAKKLALLSEKSVSASEEEIEHALTGNYRQDHIFSLKLAVELFDVLQSKILACDNEIENYISGFKSKGDISEFKQSKKKRRKNEPYFELSKELFRITGVDLTKIPGVSALTAQTIISEVGYDLVRFPTEKHFCSWLGLCPNNRITGAKVKTSRTKKINNKLATALRIAALAIHKSKSALGAFHRRMKTKLGAPKAITATAHKIAKIVYRLLKFGEDYVEKGQNYYEEKYKQRLIKGMEKSARSLGFNLIPITTEEGVS